MSTTKPRDSGPSAFLIGCDHVFRMFVTVKVIRRHKKEENDQNDRSLLARKERFELSRAF